MFCKFRTRERAMREKNLQDKNESEIAKRTQIREWHREKTRQHISQEQERRQVRICDFLQKLKKRNLHCLSHLCMIN